MVPWKLVFGISQFNNHSSALKKWISQLNSQLGLVFHNPEAQACAYKNDFSSATPIHSKISMLCPPCLLSLVVVLKMRFQAWERIRCQIHQLLATAVAFVFVVAVTVRTGEKNQFVCAPCIGGIGGSTVHSYTGAAVQVGTVGLFHTSGFQKQANTTLLVSHCSTFVDYLSVMCW